MIEILLQIMVLIVNIILVSIFIGMARNVGDIKNAVLTLVAIAGAGYNGAGAGDKALGDGDGSISRNGKYITYRHKGYTYSVGPDGQATVQMNSSGRVQQFSSAQDARAHIDALRS